jgi:hypothetical protein
MIRSRLALLAGLVLLGGAGGASAQLVLPGALPPAGPGEVAAPNPGGAAPGTPAPSRPVAAKAPAEEAIVGRTLKLNGAAGSLRVERAGRTDLSARLTLDGTRISRPGEACAVTVDGALPLTPKGRPGGLPRYEIAAPSCPITADLLDGALLVRASAEACLVAAADCRVDPRGLWGPEPAALAPMARAIEGDRGRADRAVRENYKILAQRAKPAEVRGVVSEQAAFSSERETLCRSYAREPAHGFCNARFTEARAAELAARLGVAPAAPAAPARRPAASAGPRPPSPPTSLLPSPE